LLALNLSPQAGLELSNAPRFTHRFTNRHHDLTEKRDPVPRKNEAAIRGRRSKRPKKKKRPLDVKDVIPKWNSASASKVTQPTSTERSRE